MIVFLFVQLVCSAGLDSGSVLFCVFLQVCCICLAKYENNDELRELPCSHLFHKDCVDKWLKINSLCPLCKSDVGGNLIESVSGDEANQPRGESRVGVSPINTIV